MVMNYICILWGWIICIYIFIITSCWEIVNNGFNFILTFGVPLCILLCYYWNKEWKEWWIEEYGE